MTRADAEALSNSTSRHLELDALYHIMPSKLEKLPREIIHIIFLCLDFTVLKNLRKTSKLLSRISTPVLFRNVAIWLHPESLAL